MSLLSASPQERARKAHAQVLQALREPGRQAAIAACLGTSDSTISRIKNERLEDVLAFLYAAGFEICPAGSLTIKEDTWEFIRNTLAETFADPEIAKKMLLESWNR